VLGIWNLKRNPPAFKLEELFSHETLMALRATNKYENGIQAGIKITNTKSQIPNNTKYQNPNDQNILGKVIGFWIFKF